MLKSHHTLRYLYYKLKKKVFENKHPKAPWMTADSIHILNQLIRLNDIGLEYGSGRSTIWFASRCKHLTSVEHNKKWFDIVSEKLTTINKLNIKYSLEELNDNPLNSHYYRSVNNYDDNTLDFIIVDGKYRDIIGLEAIKKLKKGGLLILDNAERYLPNDFNIPESIGNSIKNIAENWKQFIDNTKRWRSLWTTNGVTATLILIKT